MDKPEKCLDDLKKTVKRLNRLYWSDQYNEVGPRLDMIRSEARRVAKLAADLLEVTDQGWMDSWIMGADHVSSIVADMEAEKASELARKIEAGGDGAVRAAEQLIDLQTGDPGRARDLFPGIFGSHE